MTELLSKLEVARVIEALIFASIKPVSSKEIAAYLGKFEVDEIIEVIQSRYSDVSGIELQRLSGNFFAFRTHRDVAARLNLERPVERPLSRAAMEVLSIIAYHQPITRAEIEEIRGISLSRGTIDILLELDWIKPLGRRRTPGRPLTWGTTITFLDYFGLTELNDLPGIDELKTAGLLRKAQTIGGLGEQELATNPVDTGTLKEEGAFLSNVDEKEIEEEKKITNAWDELEENYESEYYESEYKEEL